MLPDPIEQLTTNHIDALIRDGTREGQRGDFKEYRAKPDPKGGFLTPYQGASWREEKLELAKDAVAFANTEGGWLLLGISEGDGTPPAASGLTPIPDCETVAGQLQQALIDMADPPLSGLKARGIAMAPDGSGVVAIRVLSSSRAPHAVLHPPGRRLCAIRRDHESMTVGMTDIARMSIDGARSVENRIHILNARSTDFRRFVDGLRYDESTVAYRISALPIRELPRIKPIHNRSDLFRLQWPWIMQFGSERFEAWGAASNYGTLPRVVLRGLEHSVSRAHGPQRFTLGDTGLVEAVAVAARTPGRLYVGWLLGDLLSVMRTVEALRSETGAGGASVMISIEIRKIASAKETAMTGDPIDQLQVIVQEHGYSFLVPGETTLPIYEIDDRETFEEIINQVVEDLFNAGGSSNSAPITVDWSQADR